MSEGEGGGDYGGTEGVSDDMMRLSQKDVEETFESIYVTSLFW